ncbi:unnamed protein product [Phytomonas sp. Hart1]|nr:unnamed protein product [Phytomonas sp. Hart1]|eukprot:CCW70669.1 unnamed protein product [Phytomonas sp. isolate Hart1]
MFEAGIIDPMKVVKSAVVNACSVAGMMITTEAAVVEKDLPTMRKRVEDEGMENTHKKQEFENLRKSVNERNAPMPKLAPPMKFDMKGL